MTISKPWAAKGVALYPPSFCMVGQNQVFNALHQFRRAFWDGVTKDIAGFFVAFGDWGLGKTRLGYEIIAEVTGRVDEWLLNPNEYVIPPLSSARPEGASAWSRHYRTVSCHSTSATVPSVTMSWTRQLGCRDWR